MSLKKVLNFRHRNVSQVRTRRILNSRKQAKRKKRRRISRKSRKQK